MTELREFVAVLLFVAALSCLVHAVTGGPLLLGLGLATLGFMLARWVWPSSRDGLREQGNRLLDWLEWLVELPGDVLLWLFRLVGRLLRGKGEGLDLDF